MKITETIKFIVELHKGQEYGRGANLPYVVHLMLVARHFQDETLQTIALLHDTLEDTQANEFHIRDLFGDEIADAVVALTRKEEEKYLEEYIPRVKKNKLARLVKLADLEENLFSIDNFFPNEYEDLRNRYEKATLSLNFGEQ